MAGYANDFSMSNNALAAYSAGLRPASKIPGVPATLVAKFCRAAEWHHSSKAYNRVNFYNPSYVRQIFGLEIDASDEGHDAKPAALAALAAHKSGSSAAHVLTDCSVRWIEWTGSLKRPHATERSADGCVVSVKSVTATVTLPGGAILTKRLSTAGFTYSRTAT